MCISLLHYPPVRGVVPIPPKANQTHLHQHSFLCPLDEDSALLRSKDSGLVHDHKKQYCKSLITVIR